MSDFREMKAVMRQSVHDALAVAAFYREDSTADPVPITVRWHERGQLVGDLHGQGFAQITDMYNVLVFNRPEIEAAGLVLRRNALVTLVGEGLTFQLDTARPADGPVEVVWNVLIPTTG